MTMTTRNRLPAMVAALVLGTLAASCGESEPIEPEEVARPDELPPGGGLLTKEEGAFVFKF